MSRISIPTVESAPSASAPLLAAVKQQLGSVPNLMKLLAVSPAALEGYLSLSGALGKGIREFRKSTKDEEDKPGDNVAASSAQSEGAGSDVVFCTECGKGNQRGVKFGGHCGAAIGTAVS